jgi:hypothetical protein
MAHPAQGAAAIRAQSAENSVRRLRGNSTFALTARSAYGAQLPLECDVEWPVAPNPPREVELLLDDDVPVELDELRGALTGLELNAVDGAMVALRRDRSRSYEYEPDPQRQLPHDERRRRHGSSCAAAAAAAPGAGTPVCTGCGRHSAERAGIM